jgi:cytochrome c553
MLLTWKRALLAGIVLGILGIVVLVSGVVPVKASSGHWQITRWFLDFASDRSVSFHSRGTQPPEDGELRAVRLGDVRLGEEIFQTNCRFCHGLPGKEQPPVARGMTPTPPRLDRSLLEKEPRELHYIIQHGIKFAGMPAWPVPARGDEVWPVVAYLRKSLERFSGVMMPVSHDLTNQEIDALSKHYHEATWNDVRTRVDDDVADQAAIERGRELATVGDRGRKIPSCQKCHGPQAENRRDDYPNLAGQSKWYLQQQLELFEKRSRGGARTARLMHPIADKLSKRDRSDLAAFYASLQTPDQPSEH